MSGGTVKLCSKCPVRAPCFGTYVLKQFRRLKLLDTLKDMPPSCEELGNASPFLSQLALTVLERAIRLAANITP